MMNLKLDRPLAVFDLETTGIDPQKDRIVQIAIIRVEPDGSRRTFESLVNPEVPIPEGATAVHGIRDVDVAKEPTFAQMRREVEEFLNGADLGGFNSNRFDVPLLQAELKRCGSDDDFSDRRMIDAMAIFHRKEKRDLTAAYRFYCDEELVGAHSALVDAEATLAILEAQVGRYEDVPAESEALAKFCNPHQDKYVDRSRKLMWNEQGEAEFTFGKLQGRSLQSIVKNKADRGYIEWMLNKDFSEEVKGFLRDALDGIFPRKDG